MMARTSLRICCALYLLGLLYMAKGYTVETGGHPKYSHLVPTEQKVLPMASVSGAVRPWTGESQFINPPPVMRPYHVLPMFHHVPVPLVDMELFKPVSGRRHFPNILSSLLVPHGNPQHLQVSPVRNTHGVEVWCGYSKVSVRVNKGLLGFRSSPSLFHLGTCSVSRSDKNFIYFHYDHNECGGSFTMMHGQIMYSNTVRYTPEPQGTVIRAVPLTLNIQCLYNRFHYSYKMGFLPVIRERMFHKTFESRVKFTISVCNERWETLGENESVMLGEPMYFEVSAAHVSKKERIFVDSCYATASKNPNSSPQHSVIHNFGCMEDSRRHGSLSRFLQRQSNFIRFSVDAFLLPQVTGTYFYLHCKVSVHNTTASATAKSCTYNSEEMRWKELYTDASVCACCEAICDAEASPSLPHGRRSLITSKSWSLNKMEQSFIQHKERGVSAQDDTKEVKFESTKGIDEEDDYTEEIVTDTAEHMEPKEKNKEMLMNDVDEEIEVIVGTVATTTKFQEGVVDHSGKVMFLGEQMEKSVDADAGTLESTIKTDMVEKSSVQFLEELLEDANDDGRSNKSEPKEISHISTEENQPEDLDMNMHVQSTIQSRMVIDEEMFLNAKQEPTEWNEDTH